MDKITFTPEGIKEELNKLEELRNRLSNDKINYTLIFFGLMFGLIAGVGGNFLTDWIKSFPSPRKEIYIIISILALALFIVIALWIFGSETIRIIKTEKKLNKFYNDLYSKYELLSKIRENRKMQEFYRYLEKKNETSTIKK